MTKTVFIVTSGEYSDFGIEAVFSTIEKAEEFAKSLNSAWREGRVREWAIDVTEKESSYWWVAMSRDGDVLEIKPVQHEHDKGFAGRDNLSTVVKADTGSELSR